ncbi:MAG: hypothetical protein GY765_26115 [bacterium]|nr:hypothetical protein [bacterium]
MQPFVTLCNDEPVKKDALGRQALVNTFADTVITCSPPFVLAVNGGWGTGKTSLLKCMETALRDITFDTEYKKLRTIWFEPWKFQFEESPAVSLLQEIRRTAKEKNWFNWNKGKREASKLLTIAGSLAGEIVLKAVTGQSVKTKDIMSQGVAFEEKYFEAKQLASRITAPGTSAGDERRGRTLSFFDCIRFTKKHCKSVRFHHLRVKRSIMNDCPLFYASSKVHRTKE